MRQSGNSVAYTSIRSPLFGEGSFPLGTASIGPHGLLRRKAKHCPCRSCSKVPVRKGSSSTVRRQRTSPWADRSTSAGTYDNGRLGIPSRQCGHRPTTQGIDLRNSGSQCIHMDTAGPVAHTMTGYEHLIRSRGTGTAQAGTVAVALVSILAFLRSLGGAYWTSQYRASSSLGVVGVVVFNTCRFRASASNYTYVHYW